jgi:hypothetical protein
MSSKKDARDMLGLGNEEEEEGGGSKAKKARVGKAKQQAQLAGDGTGKVVVGKLAKKSA